MVTLTKLESRSQEVIVTLSVIASVSFLIGGFFYLNLSGKDLEAITGIYGSHFLKLIFNELGYAVFLVALSILLLGQFIIRHCLEFRDVWDFKGKIIYQFILQACFVLVAASLLTVIHQHFEIAVAKSLRSGAGGQAGLFIGGSLYKSIGLFGSLTTLSSFVLITGIMAGYIELVSIAYWIKDFIRFIFMEIYIRMKQSVQFIKDRFSYDSETIADAFLEFEASTGTYRYSNLPPQFVHNFTDEAIEPNQELINTEFKVDNSIPEIAITHTERRSDIQIEREHAEAIKKSNQLAKVLHRLEQRYKQEANEVSNKAGTVSKAESNAMHDESQKTPRNKRNSKKEMTSDSQNEEADTETDIEVADSSTSLEDMRIQKYTKRYTKPDLNMLKKAVAMKRPSDKEIDEQCKNLEARLSSFKLNGKITEVHTGNRLTMFELQPDAGVKLSKISSLADDLSLLLGADSIRILTPIPGKTSVGIEVPNTKPTPVNASELIKAAQKQIKEKALPIALGKDVYNKIIMADLASMPHLLVSGTTGSGKSVFINSLINSLLYTRSPKELRFIMVDPKMIELSPYNGIPHLIKPVVTDVVEAKDSLVWAEKEMDRRYQIFGSTGARNIESFNEKVRESANKPRKLNGKLDFEWMELPYLVVIIDELADLMITQGKDVEIPITRIAQKARAAGIHMVIATQRPSAEIVTGLIKTNFPTRIAFKVSSGIDSRTILDTSGAEKLLGHGDMLYMPQGQAIQRLQGGFLSEDEVKKIVRSISLK